MNKFLSKIEREVKPTEEEHEKEEQMVEEIKEEVNNVASSYNLEEIQPILVGSLAKGTDLRGDKDLDIFLLFHEDVSREKLEESGLEIGKRVFDNLDIDYEIDYAEHPYVKGIYQSYEVELVPCYDTNEIKTAVDRTPHHTKYVKEKLEENPELKKEIRLLKQFMKGSNVYGAEEKIRGFSGYLSELLILYYESFQKLIKKAGKWEFGQILDIEDHWSNKDTLQYLFSEDNLIVIDPVDENRNAAAAVSKQKMAEFIVRAREFRESQSRDFFFPPEKEVPKVEELKNRIEKRGSKLVGISFLHEKLNSNVLYSQIRKTKKSLKNSIENFDFQILKDGFWTNEEDVSIILFELEVWSLPWIKYHQGPPVDAKVENQKNFQKTHDKSQTYVDGGKWVAEIERDFKNIQELLPFLLEKREGFGKKFREFTAEIWEDELLDKAEEDFLKFLDNFLLKFKTKN